jgi:GDSL-like Lipase/Acylhydrolase family
VRAVRAEITPQMSVYDDFVDRAETRWLPYLMYFHRASYLSEVVNTDRLGFRFSAGPVGQAHSPVQGWAGQRVNILAGSSTAFGVGAASDAATIPSRLAARPGARPWLNFGGRGYSSTQEALLYLLHRDLVPDVDQIVILSGLNNLGLAGLPLELQGEYGGFFFSGEFYRQMDALKCEHRAESRSLASRLRRRYQGSMAGSAAAPIERPDVAERIERAVTQTAKDLQTWTLLAAPSRARLTFVLQPYAPWVRQVPCPQESAIFQELDNHPSNFWRLFDAVMDPEVGRNYADQLNKVCQSQGIEFIDLAALLRNEAGQDWLYVDRAHFNDYGYDVVSAILARELGLG